MGNKNYYHGVVYIFENIKAQRIKVGITTNNPEGRLNDINDIWCEHKVTCQICGGHLVNLEGFTPRHVVSGIACKGGMALPLEKDVSLAKLHLEEMKGQLCSLSGSEKNSISRKIKTTEKRIDLFSSYVRPKGVWQLKIIYFTEDNKKVEKHTHELLTEYLDHTSAIGEIFCCSVSEAAVAIESALKLLNVFDAVIKEQINE